MVGYLAVLTHILSLTVAIHSGAFHRHQVEKSLRIFSFLCFLLQIIFTHPFERTRPSLADFKRYLPLVGGLRLLDLFLSHLDKHFKGLQHVLFILEHLICLPNRVQMSLPLLSAEHLSKNSRVALAKLPTLSKRHYYTADVLVQLFFGPQQVSLPLEHANMADKVVLQFEVIVVGAVVIQDVEKLLAQLLLKELLHDCTLRTACEL